MALGTLAVNKDNMVTTHEWHSWIGKRKEAEKGDEQWLADLVQRLKDGAAYFAEDGMHPNDAGYVVWAELIASRLLPELRGKSPS